MHGDYLRFVIRHLDTDCSLSGYRCDDTYAGGCQAQHDIRLQVSDFGNANARFGNDFVERNSRSNGSFDGINIDSEIFQRADNPVFIGCLFGHIHLQIFVRAIYFEQIECGWNVFR